MFQIKMFEVKSKVPWWDVHRLGRRSEQTSKRVSGPLTWRQGVVLYGKRSRVSNAALWHLGLPDMQAPDLVLRPPAQIPICTATLSAEE